MNHYVDVLKKYAVFEGRAHRAEYWYFFLFHLIIVFVLTLVLGLIANTLDAAALTLIPNLYGLAVLVPSIAVGVRRLHDSDKTGWLFLLGLIPLVGFIILIVLFALPGTPGANRFGPDPR